MILDEMVNILDVFFPKKDGYYVLTKDLCLQEIRNRGRRG